ncbi:VOC family protein [Bacillus sp. CGMCC 1.16607]|uniref:VOC family protein n=1 Tax=Bacillus sp. CGMCC 1.16607 TaxID=3351842 RepID=UPI003626D9C0
MMNVNLFEAHLGTNNLEKAIQFYENLGLTLVYKLEERRVAFFQFNKDKKIGQMLGIWEKKEPIMRNHIAFGVTYEEIINAIDWLKEKGIEASESFGLAPTEPVVHSWMPAASVYFPDPDGNSLEFITVLDGESKPELGVIYLSEWHSKNNIAHR